MEYGRSGQGIMAGSLLFTVEKCSSCQRIKGKQFTIPSLLIGADSQDETFKAIQDDTACALAIARLAPQDYHRFHSPVEGEVIAIKDIAGRSTSFRSVWDS